MKFIYIILSLIISGITLYLLIILINTNYDDSLSNSLYFALCLNLMCFPIFGFLTKGFELGNVVNNSYFNNLPETLINKLYKLFQVKYLKKSLILLNIKSLFKVNRQSTIYVELCKTKNAEIAHTIPFPFLLTCSILFLYFSKIKISILIIVFYIVFHLIPVILQRKNRIRLQKTLTRLENNTATNRGFAKAGLQY